MVGMDHDHDLAAHLVHGRPIAGLLVAAVAAILLMNDDTHRQLARQLDGPVARAVIDEEDLVDPVLGDVVERGLERLFRVVRRKHGHDFLFMQRHGLAARVTQQVRAAIPVTIRAA